MLLLAPKGMRHESQTVTTERAVLAFGTQMVPRSCLQMTHRSGTSFTSDYRTLAGEWRLLFATPIFFVELAFPLRYSSVAFVGNRLVTLQELAGFLGNSRS